MNGSERAEEKQRENRRKKITRGVGERERMKNRDAKKGSFRELVPSF